ncbi:beta-galactosidase [Isoptericola sp. S6320L]|uniref:glycoside hydrolase family 35 protein n=1 Tax=Isoptericola sp. S6320L TaxID=2926411 RepID=UPI001FF20F31|nr:beta-galactosidase family protein [Isoptericola sp. S6320L]MCK0116441.1 beta-galactosidase [Isoptericola sp. S6320L]
MPRFDIGDQDFLLDGRPHQIVSGALHFFRVHPDQWADRIHKARLMGLNTIETYVAWNLHFPDRGEFRTDGRRDLGRFLDLVAAEGLHAIVRPGPYICAEWTGGGLPGWLFTDPSVGVRRAEPQFLAAIDEYYAAVAEVVAPRQVTAGGPVLMVQVENEYGAYGTDPEDERRHYLRTLAAMLRGHGIEVPLFTSDQANDEHLARGGLPELLRTANFGSRSTERLATLRRHQPTGPLMCTEFWDGWFDSWGLHHHVTAPEANAGDLDDLLAAGASVNLYMFHGGTNFGFTAGANDKGTYRPLTTSYDYDAPLAEHGAPTATFRALRAVIARHRPVPDEMPAEAPPAPEHTVALDRQVPLADLVDALGETHRSEHPPTHDDVAAWDGFVRYSTRIAADDAVLVVGEVRDRALVALDGEPLGLLDRTTHTTSLPLPARTGELTLLVEDQGRVNYGPRIGEPKGLIGPVRTAARELTGWDVTPLRFADDGGSLRREVTDALRTASPTGTDVPLAGPVLARGTFASTAGADHFLRLDGWTKGVVWVNGFCLGRYWSAGPTRTLYVPGPLVRATGNEVVVLELHGARVRTVQLVARPDLGGTEE